MVLRQAGQQDAFVRMPLTSVWPPADGAAAAPGKGEPMITPR